MCTVTYLASGGKIGDIIRAEVTCDKCTYERLGITGSILSPNDPISDPRPHHEKKGKVD
jgi:hypothetical protein